MRIALLALISSYSFLVLAAFTRPATTKIWQNGAGTWCFYPGPDPAPGSICPGDINHLPELRTALAVHLEQVNGVAIAYYSFNGTMLGGATWPVPTPTSKGSLPDVVICLSGQALHQRYFTVCRFALHDNDMDDPAAEQCVLGADGAPTVIDGGCYPPLPSLPPSTNASNWTVPVDSPAPSPQFADSPPASINVLNTVGEVAGAIVALLGLGLAIIKGPEYMCCAHGHLVSIITHQQPVTIVDPIPLQVLHLHTNGIVTAASSTAVTVYHDARSFSATSL